MIRGLMLKTWYETWLGTLLFGASLGLVMGLLTFIVPQFREGVREILVQLPFVKSMLSALLGIEIDQEMTAQIMQAFVWVHPVVLSIVWAHEIVFCSRIPAAEIDRGTIDFLLGLPVSRRGLYVADGCLWLLSGTAVLLLGLAGHLIGIQTMPAETRPELAQIAPVICNLFCVYVAVGGIAYLASSVCSRRGPAVAIGFGLVVASFLLNFLARFWKPAQHLAFLSVLDYYRPALIVRSGEWPIADMAVLLSVGAVCWVAGGEILARRSLCTV